MKKLYGIIALLCCCSVALTESTSNSDLNKDIGTHPAWKYIDNEECGENNGDRIIGGTDAALGEYPWIVLLGYKESESTISYLCGGALVNPKYVVSAAHCILEEKNQKDLMVRLGEYDTKKEIDCSGDVCAEPTQDIPVEDVMVHESYNDPDYANDIALIRLSREVDDNGWVSPVCLPYNITNVTSGVAEVAGWGTIDVKESVMTNVLQKLKIPLRKIKVCDKIYRHIELSERQMCGGGKIGEDSCSGDSGGPLMKVDVASGTPKYYLVGVVSFGPSNCGSRAPAVYTRVDQYLPWILDRIKP